MPTTKTHLPMLNPSHLSFDNTTPVISAAQKFVIPVPAFVSGGEPLVYPEGHPNAKKLITDWQGNPIGEQGIVFWNGKDKSWAAALGDGHAIIIMNQVSEAQAVRLYERYAQLGDPEKITFASLKAFLEFAVNELGIDDMYNSNRMFIAAHMTPVNPRRWVIEAYGETFGFLKRDARDVSTAVFVDQPFLFDIHGADHSVQNMDRGGVIVAIPNPQGNPSIHAVQPDIFMQTYRLADGGKEITQLHTQIHGVSLADLALQEESRS